MKNFVFTLIVLLTSFKTFAQWQPSGATAGNIYYNNGNVGLGQGTPSEKLEVQSIKPSVRIGDSQDVSTFGTTFTELNSIKFYHHYNTLIGAKIYTIKDFSIRSWGGTDLRFAVSNVSNNAVADAMTINYMGNVGIGITSPQAMLHVNGTSFIGTLGNEFYISSGTTSYITKAGVRNNGGDVVFNSRSNGTLYLNRDVVVDVRIQSNSVDLATFLQNGNVGIGTALPAWQLEAGGIGSGKGIIMASGDEAFVGWYDRTLKSTSTNNRWGWYANNGSTYLWDNLNSSNRLSISNTGNVGIGTTTPGSFKLAVEGKIWAKEVQVALTNPGPDYVFEPTYHLKPLAEIEAYIKENKHLPEVPSAKEMEKNGVQLGEMNMLLLKKVEELTLYVIEQQKENKKQSEEIRELKAMIIKSTNR
jgi:hypothetical protein